MSTAPLGADVEAGDALFRCHARAWLEANCPPEMRQPVKSEADVCWGGKRFKFQNDAQAQWLRRMGARGWTVPTWPRRRRSSPCQPRRSSSCAGLSVRPVQWSRRSRYSVKPSSGIPTTSGSTTNSRTV